MARKKFIEILRKENKYENYILLALSIIGILISTLGLLEKIKLENFNNEKAFFIILLVISLISLILSIAKIEKIKKINKVPKPKIMVMLEEAYNNTNQNFYNIIEEHEYKIYKEEDSGLLLTKHDILFSLYKDELQYIIELNRKQINIDIDLNEDLLEKVKDEYYEAPIQVDTVVKVINEQTSIYDLINILDNLSNEHKQYYINLYNKYKK